MLPSVPEHKALASLVCKYEANKRAKPTGGAYSSGYVPSRVTVLEEEERDAQASSSSFEDLPLITVSYTQPAPTATIDQSTAHTPVPHWVRVFLQWGAGTAKSVAEGGDKQKLQVMVCILTHSISSRTFPSF